MIYHEIGEYLEKISTVSKKSTAEENAIKAKIIQIKASTENAVDSMKVDKNEKLQSKGINSISGDKGGLKYLEDRLKHH